MMVGGIRIDVVRKPIKNLHLGVYPPNGRVRVAAPATVSDDAVRLAVVSRLAWIKRQRAKFEAQARQSERNYVSGESHYFLGRRYRLNVIERTGRARVQVRNSNSLDLFVRDGADRLTRERVFQQWLRQELRTRAASLIEKWAKLIEVARPSLGIKRMKTKWGSCNSAGGRIWLNLELAKKPPQCLEYTIVHELTHFRVRNHDECFVAIMDNLLPQWRLIRDELNAEPLAHEEW
jgi:hypothetical protein